MDGDNSASAPVPAALHQIGTVEQEGAVQMWQQQLQAQVISVINPPSTSHLTHDVWSKDTAKTLV